MLHPAETIKRLLTCLLKSPRFYWKTIKTLDELYNMSYPETLWSYETVRDVGGIFTEKWNLETGKNLKRQAEGDRK